MTIHVILWNLDDTLILAQHRFLRHPPEARWSDIFSPTHTEVCKLIYFDFLPNERRIEFVFEKGTSPIGDYAS